MFTSLNSFSAANIPQFETRKALIIINAQNDSLYAKDDIFITKNHDWVPHIKDIVPNFRRYGDIVWVRTELAVLPTVPSPNAARMEEESRKLAEKNRQDRMKEELHLQDDTAGKENRRTNSHVAAAEAMSGKEYADAFLPSCSVKETMTHSSPGTRGDKPSTFLQIFEDKEDALKEHLSKPRKGQQARFHIGGTKGAEICDDLLDVVDKERDLMVTKHHYSAFDQTSLLTSLRMSLVTEIYICGCLTNVGVYTTAVDAVQHGLQVTVVEDCLGYRSEQKHEEAMRQMADILGVNGIDSEEIIEEFGGRPIPDAETPGITLEELNLNTNRQAAGKAPSKVGNDQEAQQETIPEPDGGGEKVGVDDPKNASESDVRVFPAQRKVAQQTDQTSKRDEMTPKPNHSLLNSKKPNAPSTLGPSDAIGSGDSRIIYNALSATIIENAFERLKGEVAWQTMLHRSGQVPRLVAVQGDNKQNGDVPIYRHPADESPPLLTFTSIVQDIRRETEALLQQPFNHALIQLYRDGTDNISEHSDKTLDIVRGSSVVNVSIGAQRVMTLRTKKPENTESAEGPSLRQTQRISMPHNSIFVLGPQTNREWLHGVRADKRPSQEKSSEEKLFRGERISITFRQIGTFMNEPKKLIWGTGARSKTKADAGSISTTDHDQIESMIQAFGRENHQTNFDWDTEYGSGFDVVNLLNE